MSSGSEPRKPARSVDVAAHAGVSQATVSRVLTGKDPVSEETRARVLQSLEELGYEPNLNARALKTQRTSTIAVVIADITNPFYPELVEALGEALAKRDQMMVLWNDASHGDDVSIVAAIEQGLVDGAIFATATDQSTTLDRAYERKLPVVLVNRRLDDSRFDSATSANHEGGRNVALYMARNNRRPAIISGPHSASTSRTRTAGFLEAWAEVSSSSPEVRFADFSHDSGAQFCRDVLASDQPPDAIFATNDLTALGVLDAAMQLGVSVPDDLWVVGYDDIDMAAWSCFDLTTVAQSTAHMADEAVRLMIARLDDPTRPLESIRTGAELIVRGSTANTAL